MKIMIAFTGTFQIGDPHPIRCNLEIERPYSETEGVLAISQHEYGVFEGALEEAKVRVREFVTEE